MFKVEFIASHCCCAAAFWPGHSKGGGHIKTTSTIQKQEEEGSTREPQHHDNTTMRKHTTTTASIKRRMNGTLPSFIQLECTWQILHYIPSHHMCWPCALALPTASHKQPTLPSSSSSSSVLRRPTDKQTCVCGLWFPGDFITVHCLASQLYYSGSQLHSFPMLSMEGFLQE